MRNDPFGFGELIKESGSISIEECLEAGADGVDIPIEVYHSLPGLSGTKLPLLMLSNKHLDNSDLFSLGNTDALIFGNLVHTLVLEPNFVQERYVVMPKFDNRTTSGKDKSKEFALSNTNKTIVSSDDYLKADKMAKNVLAIYEGIIRSAEVERSFFSEINGVLCKSRPDCLWSNSDFDLKTFTPKNMDFSDAAFQRCIEKFGYHLSAALRNIVRKSLGQPINGNYLIFVSTSPGHMTRMIQIDPGWVSEGESFVMDLIEKRSVYLKTGKDFYQIPVINKR